ncbi:MAG: hypothetical protein ABS55_04495 [Lautropia sp. SCN 70-15]|nr:MAG: hypothetical protein ABS55_04495 [Lautropia sp. SCN 70-15]
MMSTLVTHHNGLERVLRGLEVVVQGVYGGVLDARNAAAQRDAQVGTRTAEVSRAAAKPSLFARFMADMARRRADREFEALMQSDPRVRAEFMAAKARAEWN